MKLNRTQVWTLVRVERAALVRDLEGIEVSAWETPSLCPGWDVHDVTAHLIDSATTTRLGFIRRMVASRFDFDRDNATGIARERRTDPRQTLDALRATVDLRLTPPAPLATRLVEAVVHGEDIRRPLGISHGYEPAALRGVLGYLVRTASGFGGGRERAAGLRLVADFAGSTDAWAYGSGPLVAGSAIDILLALSGRPVASGAILGPGAEALRSRQTSG